MRSLPGAASLSPIARWLRWRLVSNSTSTSGTWAATFRIRVSRARTPSFSPMLAPGCQLWLRSDAGVTLNTSGASANIITSWADMSGKGYLFKGVGSPTLGTTTIGGFPAIGTNPNGYLQTSTAGPFIAQPDSLIVVVQSAVASPASYISIFNAGPLATQLQQLFQPVTSDTTVNVNAGTGINQALLSGNLVSAPNILQVDWGASSGSTQIYQNGQSLGAAVAAGAQSTQLGTIGATNAPGQFFTGWFAEILLFQPALTQAWRTLITRYLGARYGIAVP